MIIVKIFGLPETYPHSLMEGMTVPDIKKGLVGIIANNFENVAEESIQIFILPEMGQKTSSFMLVEGVCEEEEISSPQDEFLEAVCAYLGDVFARVLAPLESGPARIRAKFFIGEEEWEMLWAVGGRNVRRQ